MTPRKVTWGVHGSTAETTMTSENYSFQWSFKVSEICLKGMQQIKKHLFKKTHSVSARTVRAYGTWARTVPSLPLSSAWWMLQSEQVWHRSSRSRSMAPLGEGSLPAFLISYPQCHVTKAKLLVSASKRSEAPFLHPVPTSRMETLLMHAQQAENTGPLLPLPLFAHRTEIWCREASWEEQRLPPLSSTLAGQAVRP